MKIRASNSHKLGQVLFVFLSALLFTNCNAKKATVFPEKEWLYERPAQLGVNEDILDQALKYLEGHCFEDGLSETLIIKNGYIIFSGDSVEKKTQYLLLYEIIC